MAVKTAADVKAMLENIVVAEREAIAGYTARAEEARAAGEV